MFRPFPAARLREALANVLRGGDGPGGQPGSLWRALFGDLRAALYSAGKRPLMNNYIYGLGGRDVTLDHIDGLSGS